MQCPPVLFICHSPQNGDAHWRIGRPAAALAAAGVDARVCWLDTDHLPVEAVAGRVVVLQRVIMNSQQAACDWIGQLRSAGALAVVFELDDDELSGAHLDHFEATQVLSAAHRATLEQQREALRWTLEACDGATVSTEPLAAIVRRYTDRPVIVVPNAIDVEWFRARLAPQPIDPEHMTIGWCGWRRPDADLEPMAEAWARIAARYPGVRFVVAGWQPDAVYRQDIDMDRIIRLPVAPLDEYPKMYQVDIGCCAVADTPFSRCKTPIKAWEYALAGAAVVGSPFLYGDVIENKATGDFEGLIAGHAGTIAMCLEWFIKEREERLACQKMLAARVARDHSLTACLPNWGRAYRSIVASVGVTA